MARAWTEATERTFVPEVTVRLDARAGDELLAELLGSSGARADQRLVGVPRAAGWAATDDDPATAWITSFGAPVGATLTVHADEPVTELTLTQPEGDYSPIRAVRLVGGGVGHDVELHAASGPTVDLSLPAALPAGEISIEITAVDARTTIDRRFGEPVTLPAAVSEISIGARTELPDALDTGCRDDLLLVDERPVPLRVTAGVAELLAGGAVEATPCGDGRVEIGAGDHELVTTSGTGWQIDRVVLDAGGRDAADADGRAGAGPGPTATVEASSRLSRSIRVDGCPDGCWLVVGEGYHEAWRATADGDDLGPPVLLDGGFNGWWIEPADASTAVDVRWTAQRPLTVALVLTLLAAIACLVLVVVDRRPSQVEPPPARPPALAWRGSPVDRNMALVATAVWVIGAALFVQPAWGLVAAVAGAVVVGVLRQPRWAGLVTLGLLGVIALWVLWVVRRDRPWPDAGWPVRFERLHELGLFAAVSLAVAACTPRGEEP